MVVEGSRNSKGAETLMDAASSPSQADFEASKYDNFVFQCLIRMGLRMVPGQPVDSLSDTDEDTSAAHRRASTNGQQFAQPTSERECLSLIVLARLLRTNIVAKQQILSFVVHSILICNVAISSRGLDWGAEAEESTSSFIQEFVQCADQIVKSPPWKPMMDDNGIACDITDLVDGRMLGAVLAHHDHFVAMLNHVPSLMSKYTFQCEILRRISGIDFDNEKRATSPLDVIGVPKVSNEGPRNPSILPFSNQVFDKHLVPIQISVDKERTPRGKSVRIFQELTHWHNTKRKLDPKGAKTLSDKEKFWASKRNQYFMAEMLSYAASLTNAAGKVLDPETITTSDNKKTGQKTQDAEKENRPKSSKAQGGKGSSNRKNAAKNELLESIESRKVAKEEDIMDKTLKAWDNKRQSLDSDKLPRSRYLKAKAYLNNLDESKQKYVKAEVYLYMAYALLEVYANPISERQPQNPAVSDDSSAVAATLFDSIRDLASVQGLTKAIVDQARQIVAAVGLPVVEFPMPRLARPLSFTPKVRLADVPQIRLASKSKIFQLSYCGPYMDRNLDSAPDPRVPFEPDGWQRKVLDELDADKSVFVVAPTSAGKTFISFYAMERILRADDDGVLVYVAPTKALVNQIAAEIQARFNKVYKYNKSVWAIHTRDYRINNPSHCQVLVTVPHILQIMLLSPSNARSWSPKLRYIIFDEIHSIGQAEDGVVWEQLLLLAPCPIIALSATVGNPGQFSSWLSSTQSSLGNELTMIKHPHRYSDLRKFVYKPPKKFAFHGLANVNSFATLGLDGLDGLRFMHPVASLVNKSRGMPEDLSLEARDCLSLWEAMTRHQSEAFPVPADLDPELLPSIIRKADVINWESRLKDLLRKWMSDDSSPFDKIVDELGKSTDKEAEDLQVSTRYATNSATEGLVDVDSNNVTATTLPLLCKLNERNALPAILFNYDRGLCEGICNSLLNDLVAAEESWKKNSNLWKTKLSEWEQWKRTKAKLAAKKPAKTAAKKKGKSEDDGPGAKADQVHDAASAEDDPMASFNPDDPIEGFHFAARHKAESAELAAWFRQLAKRGVQPWLMDALLRGIGVHHAGMNRKYRQIVEMLFRRGYLRVVIATGTLALGINMPCATVVFSGDSIFLTALNFRQAAGRAGRRNFDLLGNVVMQNISYEKVCRLLSSRLPDLNGHFPITTTLVLRLFTLLNESGNSAYAVRAINSLLSQPRLYLDGSAFREQVLHHLRFSIEYLRRQSLLSVEGAPINFAGLTSHLYYTENSSFALNALFKGGYFHELCSEIDGKTSRVLRELMVVMAHLFGRRPCREADEEYLEKVKKSSSIVFLEKLPSTASSILSQHNKDTLEVFTTYVETFVDQHITDDDRKLPLTGLTFGGDATLPGLETLSPPKVRSAFVALSGHGDRFDTVSDLCDTARSGVFLEQAVIPHLDVYPDESATPFNAYLYDFYMHGDVQTLEKANGIRKNDVWFLLNDFSMVLATITTCLANYLKLPDSDVSMMDIVGEGDQSNNREDDIFAADTVVGTDDDASSTTTLVSERGKAVASASVAPKAPVKGKKTLDSWDDDDEDDAEIDEAETDGHEGDDLGTRTVDEMERGFLNIYKAFTLLKKEFDEKFHAMWA